MKRLTSRWVRQSRLSTFWHVMSRQGCWFFSCPQQLITFCSKFNMFKNRSIFFPDTPARKIIVQKRTIWSTGPTPAKSTIPGGCILTPNLRSLPARPLFLQRRAAAFSKLRNIWDSFFFALAIWNRMGNGGKKRSYLNKSAGASWHIRLDKANTDAAHSVSIYEI